MCSAAWTLSNGTSGVSIIGAKNGKTKRYELIIFNFAGQVQHQAFSTWDDYLGSLIFCGCGETDYHRMRSRKSCGHQLSFRGFWIQSIGMLVSRFLVLSDVRQTSSLNVLLCCMLSSAPRTTTAAF